MALGLGVGGICCLVAMLRQSHITGRGPDVLDGRRHIHRVRILSTAAKSADQDQEQLRPEKR